MFSRIRKRATYANVAMTLALVFAMTGGAYAAKKYLITSTKQISPSVLKALAGRQGPAGAQGLAGSAGPAGPAGLAGAKGEAGAEGKAGANGANGKSVLAAAEAAGANCAQGGSSFEVEGSKVKHFACNGKDGQTGFTETLPSGKTETGMWFIGLSESSATTGTAVSFNIPLSEEPEEGKTHLIAAGAPSTSECPGSAEDPKAAQGQLCIYVTKAFQNAQLVLDFRSKVGLALIAELPGKAGEPSGLYGTFAVTAP
jgi:hypothetical protein